MRVYMKMMQTILTWVMTLLMLTSCGTPPSSEVPNTDETPVPPSRNKRRLFPLILEIRRNMRPDTPLILRPGP